MYNLQSFICCLKGRRISHQITVRCSRAYKLIKKGKKYGQTETVVEKMARNSSIHCHTTKALSYAARSWTVINI